MYDNILDIHTLYKEQAMKETNILNISQADTQRFRKIVIEVMTEACSIDKALEDSYDSIGRLGEKQMHAAIKRFICSDVSKHEVNIYDSIADKDKSGPTASKRRFVADVLDNNTIFEIQTGSFKPLSAKIRWILENTEYNIMLIHPIVQTKWINYIDKKGTIGGRKKSPLHGRIEDIASELYFIQEFLNSPRFSLVLLMIEAEEYRKKTSERRGRGVKSQKFELIPVSLISAHIFSSPSDYKYFIPENLPMIFTAKQYGNEAHIYGLDTYSILKTLCHIGLLETCGSIGKAVAYKRTW